MRKKSIPTGEGETFLMKRFAVMKKTIPTGEEETFPRKRFVVRMKNKKQH